MQSTIKLFRYLYDHLPPLFPTEEVEKMKHALEHLEQDQTMTVEEIEDTMINFGYLVWPWNQAYKEFLALAENEIGEHSLLPRLSKSTQEKYQDFKTYGGTLRDLHSGRPADYFIPEERGELCSALVEMQKDLRDFVNRKVMGVEKDKYLERVASFAEMLAEIRGRLDDMRGLADKEQDHPNLAAEIRTRVRSFEFGLCLLGPELNYEAVCQSVDFFHGRKQDLNRMRGIHTAVDVDFYNEKV
ncbi:MAG: hypothetical protein UR53_C0001G0079 [Candidatus Magasanikbacteria bacterium GW2011_GWC2_34_16]|uniref:Uncharacterized protein n=2 Tax=Candidatus Magasanikiibacteriota TaxID=1752731 RepID=A0A0G0KKK9_9BACT|nr:MAG: hypothetical protein UR53_C0001G0079 [Candidatus Magasanikbacteria bacterium GW2011_GWC2_34_16]KKQ41111.1 MAG: hypothetical protein US58_C0005G0036 [Candidatus Magasanikbacteria bacterium GW2011_GWA2_37_8]